MDAQAAVFKLLKSVGATRLRSKKHEVWKLPSGKRWTMPKTASDAHAWMNNLTDLRLELHAVKSVKTQATFDHKKKAPAKKKVETPTVFLVELPEREERPSVPVSLSPLEMQPPAPPEPESIHAWYGRVPSTGKKGFRGERHRPGQVVTYSPAVQRQAQAILDTQGETAMTEFLSNVRAGKVNGTELHSTPVNGQAEHVIGSSVESALQDALAKAEMYKAQADKALAEQQRWEKIAELHRQALEIQNASTSSFTKPNGTPTTEVHKRVGQSKPKGYWKGRVQEIMTRPGTPDILSKEELREMLRIAEPGVTPGALYQVVQQGVNAGWLINCPGDKIRLVEIEGRESLPS